MEDIPENIFSQEKYYKAYRLIRNNFRKYNSLSIIYICIDHLRSSTDDEFQELQKQPWLVLLLIKWILIDEFYDEHRSRNINKAEFDNLLELMWDLGAVGTLPEKYVA